METCEVCGKQMKSKAGLASHLRSHDRDSSNKPVKTEHKKPMKKEEKAQFEVGDKVKCVKGGDVFTIDEVHPTFGFGRRVNMTDFGVKYYAANQITKVE